MSDIEASQVMGRESSDDWKTSPGRKNTRTWCKGKVGRPHEPEVGLPNWVQSTKRVQEGEPICGYRSWYTRDPEKWWCYHLEICSTCGKHLHRVAPEKCPDRA